MWTDGNELVSKWNKISRPENTELTCTTFFSCQDTTLNGWRHPYSKIISCLSFELPNIQQKGWRKKKRDKYRC